MTGRPKFAGAHEHRLLAVLFTFPPSPSLPSQFSDKSYATDRRPHIVIADFHHGLLGTLTFPAALGLLAIIGGVGSVGLAIAARSRRK